ncbi:hypothetical protein CAPTEDRAFT_188829 [Capitella teleta]|uniref:Uncharacterized protein n=1 Tax=Capitella teleta TaxID=283909 RepID=R7UMN8_CAPTE|nr:hypothetical protein CAPTEDRAFT_188829 [Capitella teleta]|eukprot:ELU05192.1 hypothetical protein CAPTEDRAFT_188829 [Capitella teleta]
MTTVIEILELRLQLASLQDNLKQFMSHISKPENEENSNNLTLSFAEAVKNTMKETLNDQKTRAEVIISEVKEEGKDLEFMTGLCEKTKQTSKPKQVSRNGRKNPEKKNCLMNVRFQSEFDVRTFRVRKIKSKEDTPVVRMRPSKTKKEQEGYNKMKEINKKLNENAKKEDANHSFSLRDDCTIWSRSLYNKTQEINDLILDHEFEVFVITKTWLRGNIGDNAVIAELTPSSFKVDHVPKGTRGGGVAVVSRKSLRLNNMSKLKYTSLEFMDCQLDTQPKVRIVLIYRLPHATFNPFMEEFEELLEKLSGVGGEILI